MVGNSVEGKEVKCCNVIEWSFS